MTSRNILVLVRRLLSRPGAVEGERVLGSCELAALQAARVLAGEGQVVACIVGRSRREDRTAEEARHRGADAVIRVSDSGVDKLDYYGVARVVQRVVESSGELPDLLLCGDRSADRLSGALGPAVAELLELPHLSGIIDVDPGDPVVVTVRSLATLHRYRLEGRAVLCIRECQAAAAAHQPDGSDVGQHLSFRELGLSARELAPRTRLSGTSSSVRSGVNATMVTSPAALVARLVEDRLIE